MSNIQKHLFELEQNFNRDIATELVEIFCSQYREAQVELKNYLITEDFEKASRLAHKMKASALNVGAKEIGTIYLTIEKFTISSLNESNLEKIDALFRDFKNEAQKWLKK